MPAAMLIPYFGRERDRCFPSDSVASEDYGIFNKWGKVHLDSATGDGQHCSSIFDDPVTVCASWQRKLNVEVQERTRVIATGSLACKYSGRLNKSVRGDMRDGDFKNRDILQ